MTSRSESTERDANTSHSTEVGLPTQARCPSERFRPCSANYSPTIWQLVQNTERRRRDGMPLQYHRCTQTTHWRRYCIGLSLRVYGFVAGAVVALEQIDGDSDTHEERAEYNICASEWDKAIH